MSNFKQTTYFRSRSLAQFRIGTDQDENGKFFLYKNGQVIAHIIRPPTALSQLESIKYQEIAPYTTAFIQVKLHKNPNNGAYANSAILFCNKPTPKQ